MAAVLSHSHAQSRFPLTRAIRVALWLAAGSLYCGSSQATITLIPAAGLNGQNGLRLDGVGAQDRTGRAVAPAGDFNADGIDDYLIGAPSADSNGLLDSGASFVVFGRSGLNPANVPLSSLDGSNGVRINGAWADDRLGFSIAAAGDFNGDGIDDVILGANFADVVAGANTGSAYIIFGRSAAFPATISVAALTGFGVRLSTLRNDARTGNAVIGLGDFNGDGFDDVAIGSPNDDSAVGADSGSVYLVFGRSNPPGSIFLGSPGFPAGQESLRLDGLAAADFLGTTLASGDVNGDGLGDLLIGAPGSDTAGRLNNGSAFVVYGRSTTPAVSGLGALDGSNGFRIDGADADDSTSYGLGAVDINGDGIDDIVTGSIYADPDGNTDAGSVHVVLGRTAGALASVDLGTLAATAGFRIDGEAGGDYAGLAVASAGDLDHDGREDLVVGAPGAGIPDQAGRAYVVYGRSSFPAVLKLAELAGNEGFGFAGATSNEYTGIAVAGAGDVNEDQMDDLLVGAHFRSSLDLNNNGAAYLLFGRERTLFGDGFESSGGASRAD